LFGIIQRKKREEMRGLFEKYFTLYFKEKAINYLKSNPLLILLFVFGVILGNCFSFIVNWIPIVGGLFYLVL